MVDDTYSLISLAQLESVYYKKHGSTYNVLKAQVVPGYAKLLQSAVSLDIVLTDKMLGLSFPDNAEQ